MSEDFVDQCCDKATNFIQSGDYGNAAKFLKKVTDRDPSNQRALELLTILAAKQRAQNPAFTPESEVRHRANATKEEPASKGNYSPEDKELADRINSKNDYYEILGLEKTASSSDIKKAYRKLARDTHPDKNKAPGAEEAFKRIAAAYSTLSDENKRRDYDNRVNVGAQNSVFGENQTPSPSYESYTNFNNVDADDIFRMFFGMNGIPVNGHQFFSFNMPGMNARHFHRENTPDNAPRTLFQRILPVIMIIGYIVLTFFLNRPNYPTYSMQQTYKYPIKRIQPDLNIPYFVSNTFKDTVRNVNYVESEVAHYYFQEKQRQCMYEVRLQSKKKKEDMKHLNEMESCNEYLRAREVLTRKYGYAEL